MKNRYENTSKIVRERVSGLGTTVYVVPPESVEDYYLITTVGDRFDILAKQYYGSEKYWYVIASANPHIRRDSLNIEPGYQIRIPLPLARVLSTMTVENNRR